MSGSLPYVDEHTAVVAAPRGVVWSALEHYATADLAEAVRPVVARVLGTEPRGGFAVAERDPGERLVLTGRHRFSRYRLVFGLEDADGGATRLSARTYAVFPGPHGAAYRLLVLGTGFHVLATTRMLRTVRSRATASPGSPA
ncbi:hypothetical protein [Mumia zhuanghuii]|uniref:DUF2867 domain-containing protein n=1 Tax=Mumia zhuanghuii TaxID=2585211 RepID=A0A5C4MFT0_9ACTN|nr:hypothetical protein [Mumia zhuanghuii]TNC39871.1 hypothetical protein FHE65_23610 [Mumia zhuanghuii]TNC41768.1 hypothetical protein FHE65_21965 [Mumia zhuanghuii]